MNKNILLVCGALLLAAIPVRVAAQTFDNSGTPALTGQYLFRYVNFFNDPLGNLTESCSLSGTLTFDGAGHYTTSNTQLFDSGGSGNGFCADLGGGTYGVQSNGLAQLDSPMYPATLFGAFSAPVVIASSTEDFYFDLFIAVQAPAAGSATSSLSGAYTVGLLDFLNASNYQGRQGYFTMTADGKGNIAPVTVSGNAENVSLGASLTQHVGASTYALAGAAGGTITFPGTTNDPAQIVSGSKLLYVSADGNWFVAGSAAGSDLLFGIRAPSGNSSNAMLSGTYFMAGMQDNISSYLLGAYWGSINTNGDGNLIWHQRFDYVASLVTYDFTTDTPVTIGTDGSYFDGNSYTYLAGAGGTALMVIGYGQQFELGVGVHAPNVTPASTVWINPIGITNPSNYTPITNAYSPGEIVSLYGNFGAPAGTAPALPIPPILNGVQVLVNGLQAPVLLTSANQINALIPYEIAGEYFATFQVIVNDSKSNEVTVYVDYSSPGIFTLAENGIGPGAILHANYTLVTSSSPAVPGETVLLFMDGLGMVTPQVDDGAAASSYPLSYSDEYDFGYLQMYLDDGVNPTEPGSVAFAGLAPGFAGLYQVNFSLPLGGLNDGNAYLLLYTNEAIVELATIPISGFGATAGPVSAARRPGLPAARLRPRRAPSRRRALPSAL